MSIFFDSENISIEALNKHCENTMSHWIGIELLELGEDSLTARMPIDHRTIQPIGVVNGGAFCTLAEFVGSVAATLCLNLEKNAALGLDINANYIKNAKEGYVYAVAKPFHMGKTTHVWEIKINDENGTLCCISRLTLAIIPLPADVSKSN